MRDYALFTKTDTSLWRMVKIGETCFGQNTTDIQYKSSPFNHVFTTLFTAAGFRGLGRPQKTSRPPISIKFYPLPMYSSWRIMCRWVTLKMEKLGNAVSKRPGVWPRNNWIIQVCDVAVPCKSEQLRLYIFRSWQLQTKRQGYATSVV